MPLKFKGDLAKLGLTSFSKTDHGSMTREVLSLFAMPRLTKGRQVVRASSAPSCTDVGSMCHPFTRLGLATLGTKGPKHIRFNFVLQKHFGVFKGKLPFREKQTLVITQWRLRILAVCQLCRLPTHKLLVAITTNLTHWGLVTLCHHKALGTFVQILNWIGAKPLPELMVTYCQLDA